MQTSHALLHVLGNILGRSRRAIAAGLLLAPLALLAPHASAARIVAIDIDGADDGPITFNPDFSFGGDTTIASTSIAGTAVGLPTGDSIFGGDGVTLPDTYVYTYTPSSQADNLVLAPGTDLGDGNVATGLVGGGAGLYNVYATWPITDNVSGGDTEYAVTVNGGTPVVTSVNQNTLGLGDVWFLVTTVNYTGVGSIVVSQSPSDANTFVSMRGAGVLFELASSDVPEPATWWMMLGGLSGMAVLRKRFQR